MDVKLGLTVRKDLWDSNFTSSLHYYNSPGWGQQDMTCMLSMQCFVWNQVGHICRKGPNTTWCTDLQMLYIADTRWWPAAQYVDHWAETTPTPFTWTCVGFLQWPREAQSRCSVVALLHGVMVTKARGVRTEFLHHWPQHQPFWPTGLISCFPLKFILLL